MAVMDGISVRVGQQVWHGGWMTVVSVSSGFFTAEGNGSRFTVYNDGSSPQTRRPGRTFFWAEPLPTFPESMNLNRKLRASHDLLMDHLRDSVKTYQQANK